MFLKDSRYTKILAATVEVLETSFNIFHQLWKRIFWVSGVLSPVYNQPCLLDEQFTSVNPGTHKHTPSPTPQPWRPTSAHLRYDSSRQAVGIQDIRWGQGDNKLDLVTSSHHLIIPGDLNFLRDCPTYILTEGTVGSISPAQERTQFCESLFSTKISFGHPESLCSTRSIHQYCFQSHN